MKFFDRIFHGSNDIFSVATKAVDAAIAEYGEDAPMQMPDTAYNMSCQLAYAGQKVLKLKDLKTALANINTMSTRNQRTESIFKSGIGTAMAGEIIEAVKYVNNPTPYEGTKYHGHFSDAEVRELGVPLVTNDIPGFVVIIDPAPSDKEACDLIRGYQERGIFVFLVGDIIDQAERMGIELGFHVRVVGVGPDIWAVSHVVSFCVRAAMIFGAIEGGDWDGFMEYTYVRLHAFVNAFAPVNDRTLAFGAGAVAMGFPVITNDMNYIRPIPKTILLQPNTKAFIETSLEARDIHIKITKIDIPVAYSTAFEGEIIRRPDMQVEIDGSRLDCFELVEIKDAKEIDDHSIIVEGPDFDDVPAGTKMNAAFIVEVGGKNVSPDFASVFERKIHAYLNCASGVMHTGQRDMIRIRVSKDDYEAGFRLKHLGEILYAKIKGDHDAIIEKAQVRIYTEPEKCKELRAYANTVFDARDERLGSLTDETVENFYTCILCQSFSPSHVCIVTPERLGLCGAVSWLDAKASNELDPNGPCQIVPHEKCIDERIGAYEDVNDAVRKYSNGALEQVSLYSILEDPMTSCGCFECICGIEPMTSGFVITTRDHVGMTPLGMTFSEMASMTGGGVQTPGYMGHGKHFIASKKFLKAEGGIALVVWMPASLKEQLADKINATAKELYGIDNYIDMIPDENDMQDPGDPAELYEILTAKNHPVLGMEPLL